MPKQAPSAVLDALTLKLAKLALLDMEEFTAVDTLVTAALKRHEEEARAKRLATLSRIK